MADVHTSVSGEGVEFLVFSNVFAGTSCEFDSFSNGAVPAKEALSSERIYKLIKNGSFALGRQQIIDTFLLVGGKTADGLVADFSTVIKLCLNLTALSHSTEGAGASLQVWFDPFSGSVELSTSNGLRDSLNVWSCMRRAAY